MELSSANDGCFGRQNAENANCRMRSRCKLALFARNGKRIYQGLLLGNPSFDHPKNEQTCQQIEQRSFRCTENDQWRERKRFRGFRHGNRRKQESQRREKTAFKQIRRKTLGRSGRKTWRKVGGGTSWSKESFLDYFPGKSNFLPELLFFFFFKNDDNHPCTMNVFRAGMKTTLWPIQCLIFFDSFLESRILLKISKSDFHSFSAFHNDFVWTLGSLRHRWYWFQNTLVQMDCWKIATNLFDGKFFDFIYQKLNLKTFEKKSSN